MIDFPEFAKAELNRIDQYFKNHSIEDYSKEYKSVDEIKEHRKEILKDWLKKDFLERVQNGVNPGEAWKIRPWVWEEFIHDDGFHSYKTFDYTYSERIQLFDLLKEIQLHPTSRQYVFNIWDREDRFGVNGKRRIPCSLNYQILVRPNGEIDEK
jgi:thymidylate synthase